MKAPAWYFRYRLATDVFLSGIVSYFVFVAYRNGFESSNVIERFLPVSATLFGFVLATTAFLSNRLKDKEFDGLRKSQSHERLIGLIRSALFRMFALCSYLVFCTVINVSDFEETIVLLAFLISMAFSAIFGLLSVLASILGVKNLY